MSSWYNPPRRQAGSAGVRAMSFSNVPAGSAMPDSMVATGKCLIRRGQSTFGLVGWRSS